MPKSPPRSPQAPRAPDPAAPPAPAARSLLAGVDPTTGAVPAEPPPAFGPAPHLSAARPLSGQPGTSNGGLDPAHDPNAPDSPAVSTSAEVSAHG